jgi:exopolysaccharide production protein ExoZ
VFGIDIFFVISGFILSLIVLRERRAPGIKPTLDFMKRRFIRIYPIYWVVALLTLARAGLAHHLPGRSYIPAFFLFPSLTYPGGRFIVTFSWTMNFEIFFYFVLGILLLSSVKRAVPLLIVFLTALASLSVIVDIRHPIAILVCNPILLEFVFGAIIALAYVRFGHRRLPGILLTAIGFVTSVVINAWNLPQVATGEQMIMANAGAFARAGSWGICAALIVGGVVFWSPSMKTVFGRVCVLLGNASYSTYLISALGLEYATRLFFAVDAPPHSFWNRLLYLCFMVVIISAIGLSCYLTVEKPLLQFLQARLLPRKPIQELEEPKLRRPRGVIPSPTS